MATSLMFDAALSKMSFLRLVPRHVLRVSPASSYSTVSLPTQDQDELYRQITVEVKAHNPAVLNSYQKFTVMAAQELGVNINRIYEPPRVITRMSLMKSVFVHKKHFHQYEMRTLYRVFELKYLTGSTASTFLEYIQRNLPEGVAMKVTKHQLQRLPDHLKPPSGSSVKTAKSLSKSTESTDEGALDTTSESENSQRVGSSSTSSSSSSSNTNSSVSSSKAQSSNVHSVL